MTVMHTPATPRLHEFVQQIRCCRARTRPVGVARHDGRSIGGLDLVLGSAGAEVRKTQDAEGKGSGEGQGVDRCRLSVCLSLGYQHALFHPHR